MNKKGLNKEVFDSILGILSGCNGDYDPNYIKIFSITKDRTGKGIYILYNNVYNSWCDLNWYEEKMPGACYYKKDYIKFDDIISKILRSYKVRNNKDFGRKLRKEKLLRLCLAEF